MEVDCSKLVPEVPTVFDPYSKPTEHKSGGEKLLHRLSSGNLKTGTVYWFVKRFSEQISKYAIKSIVEYKQLFMAEKGTEADLAEFKRFIQHFTNPYLEELKNTLKMDYQEIEFVSAGLHTVFEDMRAL